jgi:hypothetical protein
MKKPPECPGCKRVEMGYIAAHLDAQRRLKAGEKQEQCSICGLWCWPHELRKKPERT